MGSQENAMSERRYMSCPRPKAGASGDQPSTMDLPERTMSNALAARRSVAGIKVLTTLMLNAWRHRRGEVNDLHQVIDGLKASNMKAKNKLHVLNTVMRVEQKRNSELQIQLKQSHLSIDKVRTSCDSLTCSLQSLAEEKNALNKELNKSKKEVSELVEISNQTKKELFGALSEQRKLESQLSEELRSRQRLQLENEELLKKVELADCWKAEHLEAQELVQRELAEKDASVKALRIALEEKNRNSKEQTAELQKIKAQITELCHKNSRSNFMSFCSDSISRLSFTPRSNQDASTSQRISLWEMFHWFTTETMYMFYINMSPSISFQTRRKVTIICNSILSFFYHVPFL